MSEWDASGSLEEVEGLFSKIITPSLLFVIPAFFGRLVLSEEILHVIFGDAFAADWQALIIIATRKIPRAIRRIGGRTVFAPNQPRLVAVASVVDILLNLVLNLVLIYTLGIVGAAIGTILSMTIGTALRTYFLSWFITIRIPYDELGLCTLSAAAMVGDVYLPSE